MRKDIKNFWEKKNTISLWIRSEYFIDEEKIRIDSTFKRETGYR